MAFEERRTWILLVVTVVSYGVYATLVAPQLARGPAIDVSYVPALLWTLGAAVAAAVALEVVAVAVWRDRTRDERDRDIDRLGERVGQSLVVVGGLGALGLAMAEADHFWVANVLYLGFAASGVLSSVAKLLMYRRGVPA